MENKYKNKLSILTGIELGLQPHIAEDLKQVLAAGSYDFVIGSVHGNDHIDP